MKLSPKTDLFFLDICIQWYVSKNDLIFWKGHVALVISKKDLIHAYGPLKKVVRMPIKSTINRIYKSANLKVKGIRRIII